jgi:5'-nucleotidase
MSNKPLILVTNDDGIHAKGLSFLAQIAKDFGDVVVVAPDKPQSGMGHAVTMTTPLWLKEVKMDSVSAFSTSGTPVDCVKLAVYEIMHRKPDLILSGVNHGSNSSINVIYSGTMSAAVEGAVESIASIGFSLLDHNEDADFSNSEPFIRTIIKNVLTYQMPNDVCLNVNIPKGIPKGIKICRQAKGYWEDYFEKRKDPQGKDYYWMKGDFKVLENGEDTDLWALDHGYISVVPTQFDMTAHHEIANLNTWNFE